MALIRRMPQLYTSRVIGFLTDRHLPPILRKPVLGGFASLVGIDLKEAEKSVSDYSSLNAFFVRKLKPGIRPLPELDDVFVSPVDGTVAEFGTIKNGQMIQAKDIYYNLNGLINDEEEARRYLNGSFLTIYLSPKDYHRIHAPLSGEIDWASYIPGKLFPVNQPAVRLIPDLFARNERLVCSIKSRNARVAVVAVGALNVGRISSQFDPDWNGSNGSVTNHRKAKPGVRRYDPAISANRGEEIMAFHLGSTVVMLFEPNSITFDKALHPGMKIKLGMSIGSP